MPKLIVTVPTGRVLSVVDYKTILSAEAQKALFVGGGSLDASDFLLPFVLDEISVVRKPNQGDGVPLGNLTEKQFTVFEFTGKGLAQAKCQIVQFKKLTDSTGLPVYRIVVGAKPPHHNLKGPWLLSVVATNLNGNLSNSTTVKIPAT